MEGGILATGKIDCKVKR